MGPDQESTAPQAKRARLSVAPQPAQPGASIGAAAAAVPSSCTTGATLAMPPPAAQQQQQHHHTTDNKPCSSLMPPSAPSSATATAAAATAKPPSASAFVVNAFDAVHFRAVSAPTAEALTAEIAGGAGGQPVVVDFLHQHFGDSEQIRGYSGLRITIWVHVRTYHVWVDMSFAAKRPGADKLGPIFEGAFPAGYCRSQEEFVEAAAAAAAVMPDLMALGDCVGTVPLPPTAYGIKVPPGGGSSSGADSVPLEVSVRRFQVCTAPPEVKALHARLEPLLLFTIDGAQFIDGDDPQWEMLLPVARAQDGGCVVLGLTTLFNFFAYPNSCRMRVSQVLVLSPWQGLGLGKALLKLSYDLARCRSCADLTIEDPTPNLQRVREKLEVEMMRRLDWVAAQARKSLDAVVRGEGSWAVWEGEQEGQGQGQGSQHDKNNSHLQLAAATAAGLPAGVAAHPLLSAHTFFAVLRAVPPEGRALPETVEAEAKAAAEARWRQRVAAEVSAAPAAAASAAAEPSSSGAAAPAAAAAGASSAACGTVAAPHGCTLLPSASFISAIGRELKMHRGQIRVVWEAFLWCEPGALERPGVRAALRQLVTARLEAQHFSSVGRAAAAKRLVDIPCSETPGEERAEAQLVNSISSGNDDDVGSFFMYRPTVRQGRQGQAAAAAAVGADEGAIATGRLNLTQVTAGDKARRLEELLEERVAQLESLAAVVNHQDQIKDQDARAR